jgi:DNA-binding response OmpR family regulator
MGLSVVVLESDPKVAQYLANGLRSHFYSVHVAGSRDELRDEVVKNRPEAVILDIEASRLTEVESLHRDFPALPIVCTHRIPDEEMWMAALEAGAADVCAANDVESLLSSVLRSLAVTRGAVAQRSLTKRRGAAADT